MPAAQDLFSRTWNMAAQAVEDLFPTAHWGNGARMSDSDPLKPVNYQNSPVLQQGAAAATATDQLFAPPQGQGSNMPVANPTTMTIPGNPNYDPLTRRYKG